MHTKRWTLAGTALATLALTASSIGVVAQDESPAASAAAPEATLGVPAVPTGFAELDQALAGEFADKQVTMQTQWITAEGDDFSAALDPFRTATGIDVRVAEVPSGQHEQLVNVSLNGGVAADIIALAQPAAIIAYGEQGLIKDVATLMDGARLSEEHTATVPLYSSGEQVWAVPYKADVKSTVWYPIKAFEAAGYEVPTTWDELVALSDKIVADGGVPWCNAQESSGATGWITTDWIEDILLRTAGKEFYDSWTTHETPFNTPEVKRAFDLAGQMFFTPGYVEGGGTGILATSFLDAMDPMFNDDLANPGCWMQKQATWYGPTQFPDVKAAGGGDSKYIIGEDVGFFYFPPIDEAMGTPALGAGDALMVTQDRPEVRALAQYLSMPEGIAGWIARGSAISANQTTPTDWYAGFYKLEKAAEIVANATAFAFDASDLMPASGQAFWDGVVEWLSADGTNTDEVLAAIDADSSWPTE
jgi:alpha-glucoside transport system substrate-binding protein